MSYDEPEFPITDWYGQQPLPDLSRIERGRWRDVLAPLTRRARVIACGSAREHFDDALSIAGELLISDPRPVAPRLPAPSLPGRGSLTGKQVNVRLRHGDHAGLVAAADSIGLTPTALARTFIVSGVDRLLYEQRRREAELRRH